MAVKKIALMVMAWMVVACTATAQPDTVWTRIWNFPDYGLCHAVQPTSDGGYVLAVVTSRWLDGDSVARRLLMIRTNDRGDSLWCRGFDPGIMHSCNAILESDDGFLLAGQADAGQGEYSCGALVCTDPKGKVLWHRTYGSQGFFDFKALHKTPDGGMVLAGTASLPGGLNDMGWNPDFWLVKTDPLGFPEWTRTFGGPYTDAGEAMCVTPDGGFLIVGSNESVLQNSGGGWALKTDARGDTLWSRFFFGGFYAVESAPEGGYWLAGGAPGRQLDFRLLKISERGDSLWSRTYGGDDFDDCFAMTRSADGGLVLAGTTHSFAAKNSSMWLLKTSAVGDSLWSFVINGGMLGCAYAIEQTNGGFIAAGDVKTTAGEPAKAWLVKIADNPKSK